MAKFGDTGELLQVLVLRQVAEAGQEADRRPRRLHLRRVHRPLQRDHRRGAHRDRRAALRRPAHAARDPHVPRRLRRRPGRGQEDPLGRRLQPLPAHPVPAERRASAAATRSSWRRATSCCSARPAAARPTSPRRWPGCSTCRSPSPTPPRSPRPATSARTSRTSSSS